MLSGRGPASLGRPFKKQDGRTQMFISDEDDFIAKSDKPAKHATKKEYNLAKTIQNDETLTRRHTKQGNLLLVI